MYLQPRRNLMVLMLLALGLFVGNGWLLSTGLWFLAAPSAFLITMISVYVFHAWHHSSQHRTLLVRRRELLDLVKTLPFRQPLADPVSSRTYFARSHGMVGWAESKELQAAFDHPQGAEVVCYLYWTSCFNGTVFTDIAPLHAQSHNDHNSVYKSLVLKDGDSSNKKLSRVARFRAQRARAVEVGKLIDTGAGQAGTEELDELLQCLRRAKALYDQGKQ